jgi:hypothetical protein
VSDDAARQYRKRAGTEVVAVRLDLDTDGFSYMKWGDMQRCKPGDWIVFDGDDTYTIDADSFAATYESAGQGLYRKTATVWARQASRAGKIATREGSTSYAAGDYLVSNDPGGDDSYAVSRERFEATYEPVR